MDVLEDLQARGLIDDSTNLEALRQRLGQGPVTLYHGIDPTADSLHTGNLVGLLVLRRFQAAGHRPLALAGGATGMIGDPSGRSEERNLLDHDALRANVEAIKAQISRVLGPGGEWQLVDNLEWTAGVTVLDFLRDVGKHVTVNQMVARESVRQRMASEQGISFTEFSYMLLQAFDFWWLHQHRGCELQVGGSDQWGNILSGVDLIRRRGGGAAHGLSWPLLTAADGSKLGKTTGARIWLDPVRTSPYQLYQHFVRTDDRQVRQFLAWFTLLPVGEIDGLVADHEADPGRRRAQRALAREVTAIVHGDEAAAAAVYASEILFGGSPGDASSRTLATVAAEVPAHLVGQESLRAGLDLAPVLVGLGLAASRSDAARKIDQGGVYVNGVRAGTGRVVSVEDTLAGGYVLIRRGKQYGMVRVTGGTEAAG